MRLAVGGNLALLYLIQDLDILYFPIFYHGPIFILFKHLNCAKKGVQRHVLGHVVGVKMRCNHCYS